MLSNIEVAKNSPNIPTAMSRHMNAVSLGRDANMERPRIRPPCHAVTPFCAEIGAGAAEAEETEGALMTWSDSIAPS